MAARDGKSGGASIDPRTAVLGAEAGLLPLPVGTVLEGRFVIRSVLGRGGFGVTYMAEHSGIGRRVAIKEHFPEQFAVRDGLSVRATSAGSAMFKWGLDRFLEEARRLGQFKHSSIVDVTDIFEANGTAYMVLAYEDGETLASWLDRLKRPPTQAELDRLLAPILAALDHVHGHGILHRDIAPDNIMLRRDGTPVLIDFGAARHALAEKSQTLTGIVKHGYSPPEQYSRSAARHGPWSDIYALAATLYRALTGASPQDAPDRQLDDQARDLTAFAANGYRREFLAAINAALALQPGARPQSVADWLRMLGETTAVVEPPEVKPKLPNTPSERRPPDKPTLPRRPNSSSSNAADATNDAPPQRRLTTILSALLIGVAILFGLSFRHVFYLPFTESLLFVSGILAVSTVLLFTNERFGNSICLIATALGAAANIYIFVRCLTLISQGAVSTLVGFLPLINAILLLLALALIVLMRNRRKT